MIVLSKPIVEPRARLARLPFYYGWVNLVIAALAMTATLPGRTHGLGLITEPLLKDLALDRVTYSSINTWAVLLGALFCAPCGRLLDRYGTRTILTFVSLTLGLSVLAMSQVHHWLALFSTLVLIRGLGQGSLSVVSMALPGKWFTRRLPVAMGIYSVLLGIGFIATVLGVGWGVTEYGWRAAWSTVGFSLVCGLAPLSWLLVRSSPEACGLPIEAPAIKDAGTPELVDLTLAQALRSPAFWTFALCTSMYGLVWSAITLFNQDILEQQGFDEKTFYIVMAVLTGCGLLSNIIAGWLATRCSMGKMLCVSMLIFAVALAVFPAIHTMGQVMAYALALGVAGGIITVIHFAFYGQAFGRTHLGKIQGVVQALSVLTSAVGPLVLTTLKEETGSYASMFYLAAPVSTVLAIGAWLVRMPSRQAVLEPQGSV